MIYKPSNNFTIYDIRDERGDEEADQMCQRKDAGLHFDINLSMPLFHAKVTE